MLKKVTKQRIIFGIILIILILSGTFTLLNLNKVRTILSLTTVNDYPLYSMKYYGDYHLDYSVDDTDNKSNPTNTASATNGFTMMCSSFLAKNEKGEPLFCRNLDYTLFGHPITVLYTHAPGKNASLTMADLFYLGYNTSNPPVRSLFKGQGLLAAPRITIDGMNEYGLSLAILSVPYAEPTSDPSKPTTDEVGITRIILDKAKTLEEAIDIVSQYNIKFHQGAAHFMIADAKGNSAVLEFIDGKINVVRNDKPWQVCTNFILSKDLYEKVGKDRYDLAEKTLSDKNGVLSENEAMDLLSAVSQSGTIWSVVYNLKTGEADIVMGKRYDQVDTFYLDMNKE